MLKTIFMAILLFCSAGLYAERLSKGDVLEQNQQFIQIPEEFFVKERWFSWSSSFDIETHTRKIGVVHRRIFSLLPQYDFYDPFEKLLATARMRFFAFSPVFDVTDAEQKPLGSVRQYIFTFFSTFEIASPENHILAIAKFNFWRTKYTLRDPVTQEEFATLSRPFFSFFTDHWKVTITNPHLFAQRKIDPGLFVVVMTFQTDRDNWAKRKSVNLNATIDLLAPKEASGSDFRSLRQELELYRQTIAQVEPMEKDIAFVENYVEEYLAAQASSYEAEGEVDLTEIENQQILDGLERLIPLISHSDLTDRQKSALLFMIDNQLKQMGY